MISEEYPTDIVGNMVRVVIECQVDVNYIVDKYKVIFVKSRLYKDGTKVAFFRYPNTNFVSRRAMRDSIKCSLP